MTSGGLARLFKITLLGRRVDDRPQTMSDNEARYLDPDVAGGARW
jgi:hypothetical protein